MMESDYLIDVNSLIEERLKDLPHDGEGESFLKLACRHLCVSPHAKRARPLLCLYYHWLFKEELSPHFTSIAVAAEFIHAASLLHDDIIDDADLRRGKASTNRQFGNAQAVLAGDYLLTQAFDLLKPFDRVLSERAIDVVRQMTKASMLELNSRRSIAIKLNDLRKIAHGKTGALFSWCGFTAAWLCGRTDAAHQLWEIGDNVGFIFQLADDLKDFNGDKELKDVCRDIRNFEPSVPLMLAIEVCPRVKEKVIRAFDAREIGEATVLELRKLIIDSGAILKTKTLIEGELLKVKQALSLFEGSKGKTHLDQFIDDLRLVSL